MKNLNNSMIVSLQISLQQNDHKSCKTYHAVQNIETMFVTSYNQINIGNSGLNAMRGDIC